LERSTNTDKWAETVVEGKIFLPKSAREIGKSLEEIPISLAHLCISSREIGKSAREIHIPAREIGISPKDSCSFQVGLGEGDRRTDR